MKTKGSERLSEFAEQDHLASHAIAVVTSLRGLSPTFLFGRFARWLRRSGAETS